MVLWHLISYSVTCACGCYRCFLFFSFLLSWRDQASESNFKSVKSGRLAALFRVEYRTGCLAGQVEDLDERDLWVSLGDQIDLEGLKSAHRISSMDLARSEKEFEGLDELDPVVMAAAAMTGSHGDGSGDDPSSAEARPFGKRFCLNSCVTRP